MNDLADDRFSLRQLPLVPRLVLSLFLLSAGLGYFSALVQLHFQGAVAGSHLPGPDETVTTYHGRQGTSQIERLLVSDESKPFNGSGSMRAAFTTRSGGWSRNIREKAKELNLNPTDAASLQRARSELRKERDGEREAVLAWIRSDADPKKAYDEDGFVLPPALAGHLITPKYLNDDTKTVKVQSILTDRCVRCHSESTGGAASNFPLDSFERVRGYCEVEVAGGGMSLPKLAQTTHVHLLGFAMLYGLSGLILSFTSYPGWLRFLLAPLPLLAQLVDISFWWLGRIDPIFARGIVYTGGIVAAGFGLQIVLSLFNMFGGKGRLILVLLLIGAVLAGFQLDLRVIEPYLSNEKMGGSTVQPDGAAE
jgi:hypothetical protein